MSSQRPLGPLQLSHLATLMNEGSWSTWSGGWHCRADQRVLRSLTKRGLVDECRDGNRYRQYSINEAGRVACKNESARIKELMRDLRIKEAAARAESLRALLFDLQETVSTTIEDAAHDALMLVDQIENTLKQDNAND